MNNPILYDFRRTFLSKTLVFILVAMIAFAAAVLLIVNNTPGGLAASSQNVNPTNLQLWDYYTGTGYHFVGYVFDQYGSPVSGVTFKVVAAPNGGQTYTGDGTTNSSGWAHFELQVPASEGAGITITATDAGGNALINGGGQQGQLQQYQNESGSLNQCTGSCLTGVQMLTQPYSAVVDRTNSSKTELAVSELGPNGTAPTNWGVYYSFDNVQPSQAALQAMTPSQMQLLGRLSGVLTILPMFPATTESGVVIGIFNAAGKQMWLSWQPVQNLQVNIQEQATNVERFGGFFSTVDNITNQSRDAWLFTELGPNGTVPSDWGAYYKFVPSLPSQLALQKMTPSQMQFLGNISAIRTVLTPPQLPPNAKDLVIAVFTSGGAQVDVQAQSAQNAYNGYPSWVSDLWVYPTPTSYNFVGLAADQYGDPLAGANVTASVSAGASANSGTAFTNSSGLASFEVSAPTSGGGNAQVVITPSDLSLQPWSQQNGLPSYSVSQVPWFPSFWGYATANSFHLVGLATNVYGAPLPDVSCNVSVSVGSSVVTRQVSTNSTGYASIVVGGPTSGGAGVSVTMTPPSPSLQPWSGQNQINPFNPQLNGGQELGTIQPLLGGQGGTSILDRSNSSNTEFVYTILGPNGTAPPKTSVYYKYTSTVPSNQQLNEINETEMQLLGSTSGFVSIMQSPPPAPSNTTTIITASFTSSGQLINVASGGYNAGTPTVETLASLLTLDLALFVPVAGILVAFGAYGKERMSGVLESVLTRPVSRRALAGSRYVSVLLSLGVASVILVEACAVLSSVIVGFSIGPSWQLVLMLGVFVEAAAYAGIVFVLSRVFKSAALVLGPAAGLYFLTNFFPLVIGKLPFWTNFLLPGRYISMAEYYVLHYNVLQQSFGAATQLGSALALGGFAAIWLALPCAAFLRLSIKSD